MRCEPPSAALQKEGPREEALALLQRDDVFGLRAFLALRDGKLDLLAFGKRFETIADDCAEMREYIGAGFLRDKAVAFRFVEPLHGSTGS